MYLSCVTENLLLFGLMIGHYHYRLISIHHLLLSVLYNLFSSCSTVIMALNVCIMCSRQYDLICIFHPQQSISSYLISPSAAVIIVCIHCQQQSVRSYFYLSTQNGLILLKHLQQRIWFYLHLTCNSHHRFFFLFFVFLFCFFCIYLVLCTRKYSSTCLLCLNQNTRSFIENVAIY